LGRRKLPDPPSQTTGTASSRSRSVGSSSSTNNHTVTTTTTTTNSTSGATTPPLTDDQLRDKLAARRAEKSTDAIKGTGTATGKSSADNGQDAKSKPLKAILQARRLAAAQAAAAVPTVAYEPKPVPQVDDRVVCGYVGSVAFAGTVKYVGTVSHSKGIWCGVRLDKPLGKSDGSLQGVRYFKCPEKHGMFVPAEKTSPLAE
jgi:hypothetical protein